MDLVCRVRGLRPSRYIDSFEEPIDKHRVYATKYTIEMLSTISNIHLATRARTRWTCFLPLLLLHLLGLLLPPQLED